MQVLIFLCQMYGIDPPIDGLIFEEKSLAAFVPKVDANFQFDTPIIVELSYSGGNLVSITDGLDAMLVRK